MRGSDSGTTGDVQACLILSEAPARERRWICGTACPFGDSHGVVIAAVGLALFT